MKPAVRTRTSGWLLGALGISLALLVPARAQDAPGALPALFVKPLVDAGGLPSAGPGKEALEVQMTKALRSYLVEHAKGRYVLVDGLPREGDNRAVMVLSGALSHLDGLGGGAYFCSLDLAREGRGARLLGRWAGTAATYRYLSDNIGNVAGVDRSGLVGELGRRIGETAARLGQPGKESGDRVAELERLLRTVATGRPPSVSVVSSSGDARVATGESYSLKVTAPAAGSVVLLRLLPGDVVPLGPEDGAAVPAGAGEAIQVPRAALAAGPEPAGSEVTLLVLVRSRPERSGAASECAPDAAACGGADDVEELPVRVVGMTAPAPRPAHPAVQRLMEQMAVDPPGTWAVRRVKVRIAAR